MCWQLCGWYHSRIFKIRFHWLTVKWVKLDEESIRLWDHDFPFLQTWDSGMLLSKPNSFRLLSQSLSCSPMPGHTQPKDIRHPLPTPSLWKFFCHCRSSPLPITARQEATHFPTHAISGIASEMSTTCFLRLRSFDALISRPHLSHQPLYKAHPPLRTSCKRLVTPPRQPLRELREFFIRRARKDSVQIIASSRQIITGVVGLLGD